LTLAISIEIVFESNYEKEANHILLINDEVRFFATTRIRFVITRNVLTKKKKSHFKQMKTFDRPEVVEIINVVTFRRVFDYPARAAISFSTTRRSSNIVETDDRNSSFRAVNAADMRASVGREIDRFEEFDTTTVDGDFPPSKRPGTYAHARHVTRTSRRHPRARG